MPTSSFYTDYDKDGIFLSYKPGNFSFLLKYPDGKFAWVKEDGSRYVFDNHYPTHRLIEIWDADNQVFPSLTFAYSAAQISIHHVSGRAIFLSDIDGDGKIDTAQMGTTIISYSYSGNLLSRVDHPDGDYITYEYNADNKLVYVKDKDNKIIEQYEYEDNNQVAKSRDSTGYYWYNSSGDGVTVHNIYSGFSTTVTKKHGVTTGSSGPCSSCGGSTERIWDYNHNLVLTKDGNGNYFYRRYNDEGRVISESYVSKVRGNFFAPFKWDFSGMNIDPLVWDVRVNKSFFNVRQNDRLYLSKARTPLELGLNQVELVSRFVVRGDFDIQFDYGLFNFPYPSSGGNQIQLGVMIGEHYYNVQRQLGWLSGSNGRYTTWHTRPDGSGHVWGTPQSCSDHLDDQTLKRLRLKREGNTLYAYVYYGSAWVSLGSITEGVSTDDAIVYLQFQNNNNNTPISGWIDNFEVTAGEVVSDIYTPIPDAPVTTYSYRERKEDFSIGFEGNLIDLLAWRIWNTKNYFTKLCPTCGGNLRSYPTG